MLGRFQETRFFNNIGDSIEYFLKRRHIFAKLIGHNWKYKISYEHQPENYKKRS